MGTIKAAFKDRIDLYIFRKQQLKDIPTKIKCIDEDLDGISKSKLIDILNTSLSYSFQNECITYSRKLTKEEREKEKSDLFTGIKSDLNKLNSWCENSEKDKHQILTYLEDNNIIIEGIKK